MENRAYEIEQRKRLVIVMVWLWCFVFFLLLFSSFFVQSFYKTMVVSTRDFFTSM